MQLRKVLRWGLDSFIRMAGPKGARSGYVVLTPPFFKSQRVLNKTTRAIRRYEVRDDVDLDVVYQTFLEEQYRLNRLARFESIQKRYADIQAAGQVPLIVDCGANIGMSAAYFADQYPKGRIVAIEPEPNNVALARRNCPGVELIQAAVSAEGGRGSVVDPGQGNWGFRIEKNPQGEVDFVSINQLLLRHPDCEPFIIKIDIEGFEGELFSKNTEWLDRFFLVVVELHDWMLPMQGTAANFLAAVSQRKRDFVFFGENVFSISYGA